MLYTVKPRKCYIHCPGSENAYTPALEEEGELGGWGHSGFASADVKGFQRKRATVGH